MVVSSVSDGDSVVVELKVVDDDSVVEGGVVVIGGSVVERGAVVADDSVVLSPVVVDDCVVISVVDPVVVCTVVSRVWGVVSSLTTAPARTTSCHTTNAASIQRNFISFTSSRRPGHLKLAFHIVVYRKS